jgi:hypothetical protein
LFSTEVESPKLILVDKSNSSASEVQMSQFQSFRQWKAINGQVLITLSTQENASGYLIAVGQVDTSKKNTNALPLVAMAAGPVSEQSPLNLTVPPKNLSVTCVQMN